MVDAQILVRELNDSVREIGVDATVAALQNARSKSLTFDNKDVVAVLSTVSMHFGISVDSMINDKTKSMNRKYAMAFCVYYLSYLGYSLGQATRVLKRSKSRLSRMKKIIDSGVSSSEKLKSAKKTLDTLIIKLTKKQ